MPHGPRKIILIRAGRYDYAEVELSGSIQIVGPNNTGKTTLINTLQFLYVDDLRTMNFGAYTLEQTLAYYFPGPYSYVLFECLATTGCAVIGWRGQSPASGADPERFRYLGPYAAEDFFDAKHAIREPRDVAARLALKDFRLLKSAAEHRELLLPPAGADGPGLGLVALRDPERFRRFRESLKDLLDLKNIPQDQMRERLLTLADVRSDRPALDVRKLFGEDYDRIRLRREAVARFRKNEEIVRGLVREHAELTHRRGELLTRWSDLRTRRQAFEESHLARVATFRTAINEQERAAAHLASTVQEHRAARDLSLQQKGGLEARLAELEQKTRGFTDFDAELAAAARQNLKHEEQRLSRLLNDAATGNRAKAEEKVRVLLDLVRDAERSITNFDRLTVTALRQHFTEAELDGLFRLLNFGLLETPVGPDGVTTHADERLHQWLRDLARRVQEGVFEHDWVRVVLPRTQRTVGELANVDRLREQLRDHEETLARWRTILNAIHEHETLQQQLRQCQNDLATLEGQLLRYEDFRLARAEEPRWQRDLKRVHEDLARLDREVASLEQQRTAAQQQQQRARQGLVAEENAFNQVMGRYGQCLFPEFSARPVPVPDLPDDFDTAIALFLHQQSEEGRLRASVERTLRLMTQLVGEEFNGADDTETVRHLAAELEALPDKTEALERDWNALIQGLRGTFAVVLKELEAVRSAAADLNRQFARVPVSNLKSIKLEVLEAGDLVSWIRRLVDLQQPGLFDDDTQLDHTLRNFRQKLEGSPLIGFSQLFSLGLTVEGEDGVKHHYQDLKQIESHGTTIAVKVLFNLLVLRHYLRENQGLVPFFLDEVHSLDQTNRHAILTTARQLGFLAITAAPEAIAEVDAIYFLQPQQGRIVLRHRHRVGVKLRPDP